MDMLPLFGAVVAASLLGSLHCVGMCGPLVAFVIGTPEGGTERVTSGQARLQAAYHLSRGTGYVLLGVAAGTAGHLVDIAGVLAGLQPLAAGLAGATLALAGCAMLARHFGWRVPGLGLPEPLARRLRSVQQRALKLPPLGRALAIGASTTLLPCGWLYAFAVTAAGTGSPALGALVMLAFWLGTVPLLSALGAGVRSFAGALGPRAQPLASVALIAAGLFTLSGRVSLDSLAMARAVESNGTTAPDAVPDPGSALPCCDDDASESEGLSDGDHTSD